MNHRSLLCRRLSVPAIVLSLAACATDPIAGARAFVDSGNAYAAESRYQEAIIEYRRALHLTPDAADVHHKLARLYEATGDKADAYRAFERAADLDPGNVEAQTKVAAALLAIGDFARARTRAELAIAARPTHAPAHVLLGHALAGVREPLAAVAQIEQALTLDPNLPAAWTALGAITLSEGQRERALQAFSTAVAVAPDSVDARMALASFYWISGDLPAAEGSLRDALAIHRADAGPHRALAMFYLTSGRPAAAEPHLRALATDTRGQLALADFLINQQRYADANPIVEGLLAQSEPRVLRAARLRQVEILHGTRRPQDAFAIVDSLLRENSRDADAHVARARLLLARGGAPAEAVSHARQGVAGNPTSPVSHYVLGLAALAADDRETARGSFEEVIRLNPHAGRAHLELARLHLAAGTVRKAIDAAERAVGELPDDSQATVVLARSLSAGGQRDKADAVLRNARSRDGNVPLLVERGWLALASRNVAAAETAFTAAYTRDPQSHDTRAGLIATAISAKQFDHARARLRVWRDAAPMDKQLRALAAQVEIAAGQLADAEHELSGDNHPDLAAAHELLAQSYAARGETTQALAQYERLALMSPTAAAAAHTAIGVLHDRRKDHVAARAAYERALLANPAAAIAANNLGWLYAREGRLSDALTLATRANELLGGRAETQHTMGWVYLQMDLPAQAISALESARRLAPGRAIYHYHAALAYLKAADHDRAQAALEKALSLDATFEGAAEAKAQLTALRNAQRHREVS